MRKPQQSQTSLVTWEVRASLRMGDLSQVLNLSGLPLPQEDSDRSTSGRGHGNVWDQNSANISYTRTSFAGWSGVRSSCRHSGTRACLSRERGAEGRKWVSLSPLPCIVLLSPPVEALPLGPSRSRLWAGKAQEGLRSDPEHSPGDSVSVCTVCAQCRRNSVSF